ncbi:18993_t:CDS:2, partial [Dentiscutata erythropus]
MSTSNTCTSVIFVGSIIYIEHSTILCLFKFPKECCECSSLNSKLSGLFVLSSLSVVSETVKVDRYGVQLWLK